MQRLHGMLLRLGSVRVQNQRAKVGVRTQRTRREKEYKKGQLQMVKLFAAFFTTSFLTAVVAFVFGYIGGNVFSSISYLTILSRSILLPLMEVYLTHEVRSAILNTFFGRYGDTHTHSSCCKGPHSEGSQEAGNALTSVFPESGGKNAASALSTESGVEEADGTLTPNKSGGDAPTSSSMETAA